MAERFKCSSCKNEFDIKDRAYFSYSQGNQCRKCWDERNKRLDAEDKKEKIRIDKIKEKNRIKQELELENKIRKIVNKVLNERDDKKRK